MPTPKEIKDAIALRKKLKENGLHRAIELMDPIQRSYARRIICHALEAFAASGEREALQQLAAEVKQPSVATPDLVVRDGENSYFSEPGTSQVFDQRSKKGQANG